MLALVELALDLRVVGGDEHRGVVSDELLKEAVFISATRSRKLVTGRFLVAGV